MTIKITVNDDGSYSVDPETKGKDKGKGAITWQLKTSGYHFVSPGVTWGEPDPTTGPSVNDVFSGLTIKDKKITVDDTNLGGSTTKYPYSLSIAADDKTDKKAVSKFKADALQTMVRVANGPVIRNDPT